MNTHTLGRFCTPRIGRADIDVARRAVDKLVVALSLLTMSSQARPLCYPRSNFLVISSPHQGGHRGSLGQYFYSGFHFSKNPIRLAFALALYTRFLTELSQPLGTVDIKLSILQHPKSFQQCATPAKLSNYRCPFCKVSNVNFERWCYIGVYT